MNFEGATPIARINSRTYEGDSSNHSVAKGQFSYVVGKAGDCNGDGQTTIDEVQKAINQFLGILAVQSCCDLNGNGLVTIDEVQKVINAFLGI